MDVRAGHRSDFRAARGFTLVELLLAITLLSMLLAMAYGGFRAATRAADQGQAVLEESSRLRLAHQFVHRQLNQMLPIAMSNEEGEEVPAVFEGAPERIRFVGPMPGYLGFGGPQVQELSIVRSDNGLALMLTHALLQGFEESKLHERDPIMLIDSIEWGEFMFQGRNEEGEPGEWESSWDEEGLLPLAVSLHLGFDGSAHVEWPGLIASVRIDSLAIQQYIRQANLDSNRNYNTTIKDLIDRRRDRN